MATKTPQALEQDERVQILNSLLTTPHRALELMYPFHTNIIDRDPLFYAHLAPWYERNGSIRDHKELFVVGLALSKMQEHREIGLALLSKLDPFQVARVVMFVKGAERTERTPKGPKKTRVVGKGANRKTKEVQEYEVKKVKYGLYKQPPRSMRTEIRRFLEGLESNPARFDGAAASSRKALKYLYSNLRIKAGERAHQLLFTHIPPEGSLAFYTRQIAKATSPEEQAKAIVEHKIPYRIASSIVKEMTAPVMAALINAMTPQELVNNISSLEKRGARKNEDLKKLIDEKLKLAQKDKRVATFKTAVAAEAAGADEELREQLHAITESRAKARGRITRDTALFFDMSGSMETAIEVGKRLGSMIAGVCEGKFYAYAFNTACIAIQPKTSSLADWEKAMAFIRPTGGTSCGVALQQMQAAGQVVDQIVFVTDEDENQNPTFSNAYQAYAKALGVRPEVTILKVPSTGSFARGKLLSVSCRELGLSPNLIEFKGDYYALDNVLPLLASASMTDLVNEILAFPLPERKGT